MIGRGRERQFHIFLSHPCVLPGDPREGEGRSSHKLIPNPDFSFYFLEAFLCLPHFDPLAAVGVIARRRRPICSSRSENTFFYYFLPACAASAGCNDTGAWSRERKTPSFSIAVCVQVRRRVFAMIRAA